ncbi:MAG: hypothetical protein ABSE22_01280 [Xanthobacteraceae bacterium]
MMDDVHMVVVMMVYDHMVVVMMMMDYDDRISLRRRGTGDGEAQRGQSRD